jgi:hypothetical protein
MGPTTAAKNFTADQLVMASARLHDELGRMPTAAELLAALIGEDAR